MAELVEAAEAVEGVAAEVVRVTDVRVVTAGILIGFGAGFGVAWWVANRRLATRYEQIAENEIAQMRDHYRDKMAARRAEERKPSLREMKAVAQDAGYSLGDESAPSGPPEPEQRNVFEDHRDHPVLAEKNADEDWDYEVEVRNRNPERPYIIHEDEMQEKGYPTTNLTYYEGDDILAESLGDHIIENRDEVVGIANIGRWGHGSRDPSVVFIRNEILEIDIELCRSTRTFAEDVHGITHSDVTYSRMTRRHREDE